VTLIRRCPLGTFFVPACGLSRILESPQASRQATEKENLR
jgi:hypothetical protein